ncbi:hypothetical protein L5515_007212 [Caenorhabditis briggsae]|uniref:Glycosyltransferase family 92 protein n=1 Tax=Caenorhabditis briggsae TaxID=6238 RepID=A0AAE9F4H1_CAEBR|nr:hypothetical protein L5515_007212 [Caenorhabditis briggsae]
MVLLVNRNTMRDITKYKVELVATNGTGESVAVVPKILKESYANCAYVNVVAHATGIPKIEKLEIVDSTAKLKIPFRLSCTSAPAPVIICISPQFVAEQWQIFVAHIAHHFGGHLRLYVTSMLESYFNLVKEYEKLGHVTVDFWMRYRFQNSSLDSPEPNSNVEWRNQAGATTDFLLQYKEVASFITFVDLDDVLIPRGYNSYYDEFSSLYYFYPDILTFQYPKREIMLHNKPNFENVDLIPQRTDLPCVTINLDADYKSGPAMNPITFHYHSNPMWSKDSGCFT